MKHWKWQLWFGLALVALSAALYWVHYAAFHDAHHIFIYLVGDIAFVPIEVLLVTLILHQLLTRREKRSLLGKLNMVIGTFFSEVGTELLGRLAAFDASPQEIAEVLDFDADAPDANFASVARTLRRIASPFSVSTLARSYAACIRSQTNGLPPK